MIELWHLSNVDWLRKLPEDEVEALRRAARLAKFEQGSTIFAPTPTPENVFILEDGLVRIYRLSPSGSELTLGYIHPGEVFGELTAFDEDAPRESFAEAVRESSVLCVAREDFVRAIRSSAAIVFEVAMQIEGRFKRVESRVEDLVFRSARSRLGRILIQLAEEFGQAGTDGMLIDAKLTHADLAKLVGTTRPTVSIALGELEDAGVVTRERGRFLILLPDQLRAVAAE